MVNIKNLKFLGRFGKLSILIGAAGVIALLGVLQTATTRAAGAPVLSMQPSASSYTIGQSISVSIYLNTNGTGVNGVDAFVNFSPTADVSTASAAGNGVFTNSNSIGVDTPSSGSIEIAHDLTGGATVNGSQELVDTVQFTAAAAGTVTLSYGSNTAVTDASGNNLGASKTGTSFTIQAASSGGGSSGGGSSSSGGSSGSGSGSTSTPTATPATNVGTTSSKASSVSVSTKSAAAPVTVPSGSTAQVSQPVTVQPATVQTQGVQKVLYYIDGKLVATETEAPYSYHVDTTALQNGKHTLVTKTYYSNGTSKSSTQDLVVTDGYTKHLNVFDWILLPAIVIGLVVLFYLFRGAIDNYFNRIFQRPMAAAGPGGMVIGGVGIPPTTPDHQNVPIIATPAPTPIPTPAPTPVPHSSNIPEPSSVIKPNEPPDQPVQPA